ncbi:MAG TPA: 3-hydroxyacyl-CoA dehydrogenase NAD-binding domain-containing protein [Acetobacteraceae bacterium]|jgi:3-hydroxyacyl-CoA dehydrogenase
MQANPVRLERSGDVGLILVNHPPVNALSHAVRLGLLEALGAFEADASLRAAVLACDGRTFIAGADINEFNEQPEGSHGESLLHVFLRALDACRKPVVAALHGTALGGGFEVALACHARAIAPDGYVGFPEVRIGLLPGAGGTQRTPRLAGPLVALDLVTSGRHVPADEAMALGLVDELATDLRRSAIARARQLADGGHLPRVSDRGIPAFDQGVFDAAVAAVRKRARGALAPVRAAEAVAFALTSEFQDGMAHETVLFRELLAGPQSRALRHMFRADRVAARPPAGAGAWPVRRVGVVGGGTMGSGISVALSDAGLDVTLVEVNPPAADAARTRVHAVYDRQLRGGRLSDRLHHERTGRIRYETELRALRDADLVIEAVIEDLDAKRAVFRALSGIVRRDTVLASNTSYLDVNLLADEVDAPERVLGLHFFSPAHVMRLLEVVRPARALPEALATALDLARRLRKQAVVAGVCDGFIGNRILAKSRAQAEYALEDGALPAEVDAALEAYGMAMGIFAVLDMAGLDVDWADRKRKAAGRDPRERVVPVFQQICERGRFGQKTGRGFYIHRDGQRLADPEVAALVEAASAARGITRRHVTAEEIQQRVHAATVNEGAKVLSDGIAARPSDIDVVLVHGYGYPAWRGGPMHEADAIGIREMLRRVETLHEASGVGWEPAPLLVEMAAAGKNFADLNG